jgi:site-specific DNA-methyltransferase (adenine-specific)
MNKLYFGDNLEILREYIDDASVDLVYLDPPFNSDARYNVLFQGPKEAQASAQAEAFRDTWLWGEEAEWSLKEIMRIGGTTARLIDALHSALQQSDMMAYLVMMAVRLHELRLKLKETGTLYLHCDPTASHYLKIILDSIFGPGNFRSELIWRRSAAHNKLSKQYGPIHDTVLFYSRGEHFTFHPGRTPYSRHYITSAFTRRDEKGAYRMNELTGQGARTGDSGSPWRGYDPTPRGRHWAIPASLRDDLPNRGDGMTTQEMLDVLDGEGWIVRSDDGRPTYRQYPGAGVIYQDIWAYQSGTEKCLEGTDAGIDEDVKWLDYERERIGYPTQKPLGLLERIVKTSSDDGHVVLDPFCGCGTTIEAAERLGRQWLGIDIAVHAIKVIEARLGDLPRHPRYEIEGLPRDFASAMRLAEKDKYQFQWWANYLFYPHALREQKKGADRGIDGELFFPNGPGRAWGRMLTSVKGGESVGPEMVRAFARVLDREKAQMGLFICLYPPTREMRREAASVGFADVVHGDIPKLQIVAIEDWFKGAIPALPPLEHLPSAAFSSARRRHRVRTRTADIEQPELPFSFVGGKPEKGIVRHLNPRMVKAVAS